MWECRRGKLITTSSIAKLHGNTSVGGESFTVGVNESQGNINEFG